MPNIQVLDTYVPTNHDFIVVTKSCITSGGDFGDIYHENNYKGPQSLTSGLGISHFRHFNNHEDVITADKEEITLRRLNEANSAHVDCLDLSQSNVEGLSYTNMF